MDRAEMEKRCKEAIKQTGDQTMVVVVGMFADLEYDMNIWYHEGHKNTEDVEKSIGQCYVAIKMIELYLNANTNNIEKGIQNVLSYS